MSFFYLALLLSASFSSSAQDFSVATQNLWHYPVDYQDRSRSLRSNLETELTDIAAFQEAFVTGLNGEMSLFKEYINVSGHSYEYLKTTEKFHFYEGLAIAGRFPILKNQVTHFTLPHDSETRPRRMLLVPFQIDNQIVYVFNLHLSPFPKHRDRREDQLQFVADVIRPLISNGQRVIVTGDFNQDYDESFFKPLYDLKMKTVGTLTECTFCSANKYSLVPKDWRFDYIFYTHENLDLLKSQRINVTNPISDHYGLSAIFKFVP